MVEYYTVYIITVLGFIFSLKGAIFTLVLSGIACGFLHKPGEEVELVKIYCCILWCACWWVIPIVLPLIVIVIPWYIIYKITQYLRR